MACDELKTERKKITAEAIKEHQLATTGGTTTGQFKCNRCGKRKTSYNQVIHFHSFIRSNVTLNLSYFMFKKWR